MTYQASLSVQTENAWRSLSITVASCQWDTRLIKPQDDAAADRVGRGRKDDRDRQRFPLEGSGRHVPGYQDDVGLQADQLGRLMHRT